jgi:hypothetical protein
VGERHRDRGATVERWATDETLVGEDADRVDVRGRTGRPTLRLLGGEVPRGPHDLGRGRQLRARVLEHPGDAEVGQLGRVVRREQHVGRLDVAVHEAAGVRGREPVEDAIEDAERPRDGQRRVTTEHLREGVAVDPLHDDERGVLVRAHVVDRDHVRMLEPSRAAGLAEQASALRRVAEQLVADQLHGDGTVEDTVVRGDHPRHPADAEHLAELVARSQRRHVVPGRLRGRYCHRGRRVRAVRSARSSRARAGRWPTLLPRR